MRLLKKIGIFLRLKYEETLGELFKSVKKNFKKIAFIAGTISVVLFLLTLLGFVIIINWENPLVILFFKPSKLNNLHLTYNQPLLSYTLMGVLFIFGLFLYCMVSIMGLIFLCLILLILFYAPKTFFAWIRDNWKQAERELLREERKEK